MRHFNLSCNEKGGGRKVFIPIKGGHSGWQNVGVLVSLRTNK